MIYYIPRPENVPEGEAYQQYASQIFAFKIGEPYVPYNELPTVAEVADQLRVDRHALIAEMPHHKRLHGLLLESGGVRMSARATIKALKRMSQGIISDILHDI